MMPRRGRPSIRARLLRVTMFVAATALVTASTLFVLYDVVSIRAALVARLTSAAQMAGLNGAPAVVFSDRDAAAKTLGALRAEPHVEWAAIYTPDGRLFASYRRPDVPADLAPPLPPDDLLVERGHRFGADTVDVAREIRLGPSRIGTVLIRSDLREVSEYLSRYGLIVLLVSLASFGLTLVLSARVMRSISAPIQGLADAARAVSRGRNYAVRAGSEAGPPDELSVLVETFNEMLERVQRRDEELERLVEERTRDLGRSRALLAEAQRVAQIGTFDYDVNSKALAFSDELYRLYGLDPTGAPPEPELVRLMTLPADRPAVDEALARARATGGAFSVEFRIARPDGVVRVFSSEGTLTGPPGREHVIGLVQDVTERRAAEAERERAERERAVRAQAEKAEARSALLSRITATLASTLDYDRTLAAPASVTLPSFADWCVLDVVDPDGAFRRANVAHRDPSRAEDVARLKDQPLAKDAPTPGVEAIRTGRTIVVSPDEARRRAVDPAHALLLDLLGEGHVLAVPIAIFGERKGSLTWCRASQPWDPADVVLAEEIAHRTGVAVEHARLYLDAQQANRLKDEFLATLSHELRTPLHAIVGWAHMLKSGKLDAETTRRAVETIDRNAHVQNQLISDVLDVSRIMAGKLRLNVRETNLVDVLDAALDSVRPAADAREVALVRAFDPAAAEIAGDPDRLQQVVWNLAANAIKFAPVGGRVVVRLARAEEGGSTITVEDDGPGIRPEFLPYVFERFRQADSSSTRPHGGLGLGLAIVRHLVELHGGTAEAANRTDGKSGAVFTVRLPRGRVAASAAPSAGEARAEAKGDASWVETGAALAGVRVLVVDDEPDSRDMVATVLELAGAEALVAGTAADGFALLQRERPHVLLSDLEMPGEDGYSLLRRVRALPADAGGTTPAAALTAYASAEHRARTRHAGFQTHVAKPVQPAELVAVVSDLAARPSTPPAGRKLLIVEDDPDSAESLDAILSGDGFETRVARDGPSALVAARSFRPGVVLLDLGLPGMSGLEVARRLRADEATAQARLVALTGYASADEISRTRDAGFDRHLVKPVSVEQLKIVLDGLFLKAR